MRGGGRAVAAGMAAVVLPAAYLSSADGTSAPFGFPPVSEEPLKEEVCFYMLCFALLCVPNAASTGFGYVNPAFSSLNVAFLAINVTFNGRVLPVSAASLAMLFCRVSFGCRCNEESSGMPLPGEGVPGTGACRAGGLCLAPQTQAFDASDTSLCRAERLCLSRQSPAARERGRRARRDDG